MSSVVEVLGKAGIRARDLAGVGITNQRETTIVWDRETGKPVYNAIVWQDRRTAERCHQMKTDGTEETVRQKTGLLIDPYFSSSQNRLDPGKCRWREAKGRGRQAGVRNRR